MYTPVRCSVPSFYTPPFLPHFQQTRSRNLTRNTRNSSSYKSYVASHIRLNESPRRYPPVFFEVHDSKREQSSWTLNTGDTKHTFNDAFEFDLLNISLRHDICESAIIKDSTSSLSLQNTARKSKNSIEQYGVWVPMLCNLPTKTKRFRKNLRRSSFRKISKSLG